MDSSGRLESPYGAESKPAAARGNAPPARCPARGPGTGDLSPIPVEIWSTHTSPPPLCPLLASLSPRHSGLLSWGSPASQPRALAPAGEGGQSWSLEAGISVPNPSCPIR